MCWELGENSFWDRGVKHHFSVGGIFVVLGGLDLRCGVCDWRGVVWIAHGCGFIPYHGSSMCCGGLMVVGVTSFFWWVEWKHDDFVVCNSVFTMFACA